MSWLVSPRWDLTWIAAPAGLGVALGALSGVLAAPGGETPEWAWIVCVLGVDVAHVHATTLRVYFDRAELRRRPGLYCGTPLAALLAGAAIYATSTALFWRLLAYVAAFHFVRQQTGLARLYARRAGCASWPGEAAVYAATLYPLLAWHCALPRPFAWMLPGDFVPGLPGWLEVGGRVIWVLTLVGFGAVTAAARWQGRPVSWGLVVLVVTTAASWYCGIVLWSSDFAFTVTNTLAHGIPYLALSHRVAGHRGPWFARRPAPYLATLALLAYAEEWLWDAGLWRERAGFFPMAAAFYDGPPWPWLVPILAVPQLTHYVLDAYLWKARDNPAVAHVFAPRCSHDLPMLEPR